MHKSFIFLFLSEIRELSLHKSKQKLGIIFTGGCDQWGRDQIMVSSILKGGMQDRCACTELI